MICACLPTLLPIVAKLPRYMRSLGSEIFRRRISENNRNLNLIILISCSILFNKKELINIVRIYLSIMFMLHVFSIN